MTVTERRRQVRRITQGVGASVRSRVPNWRVGQHGTVTGHYDDDSVYVLWTADNETERMWTEALELADATP